MVSWYKVNPDGTQRLLKTFKTPEEAAQYWRSLPDPDAPEEPANGCWNCYHYDGDRCMKEWNNLDPCYYLPDRDDKEPTDYCEDHDKDESIRWDDIFGED